MEKHVASSEAAAQEAGTLERLHAAGLRVPYPVTQEGRVLKMPYLPGETLPELLARWEAAPEPAVREKTVKGIIGWLGDFYRAAGETGEIRGDVNGRNFLWDGASCWGMDFEERVFGVREQDIGGLIAFVLTYDPPGTPLKTAFAECLLRAAVDRLGIDPEVVFRYRDLELIAMRARRGKK